MEERTVKVPDILGLRYPEAQRVGMSSGVLVVLSDVAEAMGVSFDAELDLADAWMSEAVVIRQVPPPGWLVQRNSTVLAWLTNGPGPGLGGVREPRRPYPPSEELVAEVDPRALDY